MKETHQDYNEIDLIDYLKIVYKWKWLILAIMVFGVFSTGIASLRQGETYEASATFFPLSMNVQSEAFPTKPTLDIKDMIMVVVKSRNMADRVIEQLDLKKIWNLKRTGDAEKVLQAVTKISLEQHGIIKLSVCTASPDLSVKIANAYVDNLEFFNSQLSITAQRQIVQVIDRATAPEERMPRNTVAKATKAGFIYLALAVCLIFLLEFIKKSDVIKRITEK